MENASSYLGQLATGFSNKTENNNRGHLEPTQACSMSNSQYVCGLEWTSGLLKHKLFNTATNPTIKQQMFHMVDIYSLYLKDE